jgi:hypothetical protein
MVRARPSNLVRVEAGGGGEVREHTSLVGWSVINITVLYRTSLNTVYVN